MWHSVLRASATVRAAAACMKCCPCGERLLFVVWVLGGGQWVVCAWDGVEYLP